ncbi:amino acid permease [Candidatus Peregrinibacteria bacterium]|nr:amino acid permease [Candidatus Peregrinibacteria bacterium]
MAEVQLKRELGLFHTTLAGVGIILGAGIYVLIGAAAGLTGNTIWLAFVIGAVVSLFTGFSYAELSSMFPKDSAEYSYTEKSFGKGIAFFIGYLVLLSAIISASAVAIGFAGYFGSLFKIDQVLLISMMLILFLSYINFRSIKVSSWMNILCTLIEMAGLVIIIALGIFKGFTSHDAINYLEMPNGFSGVLQTAALVFFAYIGFESVVKLSEETKNPTKIIPKALILSVIISTVLYIAVAVAAITVLDWEALAASKAPLADVAAVLLGNNAFILLSVIALFSTANTVLISLIAGSRALYGISREYKKINIFTRVHPKNRTPHIAIWLVMIVSLLFCLIKEIDLIAELTNFTIFITFALINLSLIFLRYKSPDLERPYKAPLNVGRFPVMALFGILSCVFLTTQLSLTVIIGGFILSLLGFIFYFLLK